MSAIRKYASSDRRRLGLLRVHDDVLVLYAMRWPGEIRDSTELLTTDRGVRGGDRGRVRGHGHHEAIAQLIEAKRKDKPLPQAPEPEAPAAVLDLMAAMQESVSKTKACRGVHTGSAEVHELPQPKKAAAKKQPAKKAPAKKSATKKTAGRRRPAAPRGFRLDQRADQRKMPAMWSPAR
ncbi:hypothetical protein [Streptomyces flaveolus]|uniref:hypothetical protein n=1 Tax=Streptomyces flaveolus TaxID=67297 RepID=UPI0033D5ACD9